MGIGMLPPSLQSVAELKALVVGVRCGTSTGHGVRRHKKGVQLAVGAVVLCSSA